MLLEDLAPEELEPASCEEMQEAGLLDQTDEKTKLIDNMWEPNFLGKRPSPKILYDGATELKILIKGTSVAPDPFQVLCTLRRWTARPGRCTACLLS